jgi:hypothetical protein
MTDASAHKEPSPMTIWENEWLAANPLPFSTKKQARWLAHHAWLEMRRLQKAEDRARLKGQSATV